ncbi:TonB-dependent receptor plug domain-containing protein [Flavobacterium ginsengisoli]|uniref:TonB-dependent receptor plug domain-containing protein n=1 Tax=Flavobacterium ginsengisoli TaxID=871694 RepID=UPI002414D72D|nr:TonB-dependent receptor plug domain-containing protein [Flavobacterium ginsengisoli]
MEGSSKTASTDFDGKFEINAPANAVLSFSFMGFDTQKISVSGKNTLNVVLRATSQNLKEVVVIGYGSVKKADLTGSVSTVKTKALEDIPSNSVEQVLQGRVAGLQVTTSQDPGSTSTVRIRGGSSLRGSNAPLVVLDGFPLGDAGDLKQVNVADIDKVDVLKDASASAIYGSRGANGVIIITTKSAKKGKTQILVREAIYIF